MTRTKRLPLGGGVFVYTNRAHTFGTDTVLLADFAAPSPGEISCDLGTGCAAIPLLWCRDGGPKHMDAVELSEEACQLAHQSIAENNLGERISLHHADLRRLDGVLNPGRYHLVTINPPYFPVQTGASCSNAQRAMAREERFCTLPDAATAAARLLREGGRFCLCHRPERLADLACALRAAGVELKRLRMVCPREGAAPSLLLAQGLKGAKPSVQILPPLILYKADGAPTPEYRRIYGAFAVNPVSNREKGG